MAVEPEKHEGGPDKDGSEAGKVSLIIQPPELDSLDGVSCSKFQDQSLRSFLK